MHDVYDAQGGLLISKAWWVMANDFTGLQPTSVSGNAFLFVCSFKGSKDIDCEWITDCVGRRRMLPFDNGTQFRSELAAVLCKEFVVVTTLSFVFIRRR